MQYTELELQKLIKDVEKEFTTHLSKAEEELKSSFSQSDDEVTAQTETLLVKAEEKPAEEKGKKPEFKADKKVEAKEEPKEEQKEVPKADHVEEAPHDESKEQVAPKVDGEEYCDYDDEDLEHMHKMYMSMSKTERKAHHDAIMQIAKGEMGAEMNKSEDTSVKTIEVKAEEIKPNPEVALLKSEVEAHKAKSEELKKNLDAVQEFLTKLVKQAPQGKAITSMEQIAKSEDFKEEKELSKNEISVILSKKVSSPSLTKSDRDAINAFYLNGANINTISHLLKN